MVGRQAIPVVKTTTLEGKKAELSSNIDLPPVSIMTSLSKMPFMGVIAEIRKRSIPRLCKVL